MESEHHAMAEALAETGAAMTTLARERFGRRRRGGPRERRRGRRRSWSGTSPTRRTSSSRSSQPHLETPEWKAVEKKLSRQPPGVAGRFFAWLTDGMSDDDRAFLRRRCRRRS